MGVTNFSPFAVMVSSVLKAELIDFTAKVKEDRVVLNWQTVSEVAVKNFEIEKSLDGKNFLKINEVKANNTPSVYSVVDNQFSQSSYYRLKINDLDGKVDYSKIINLQHDGDKVKIKRTAQETVLIETDEPIESVILTNTLGQILKTTKEHELSLLGLPDGNYIISVRTNKQFVSQKIVFHN